MKSAVGVLASAVTAIGKTDGNDRDGGDQGDQGGDNGNDDDVRLCQLTGLGRRAAHAIGIGKLGVRAGETCTAWGASSVDGTVATNLAGSLALGTSFTDVGEDRAPFDTVEHIGLLGSTEDPRWRTEWRLVVVRRTFKH